MSKDSSVITPGDTAHIADTVYAVRTGASVSDVFSSQILGNFEISDRSKFDGVTGGVFLNAATGFGVAARGKGEFEGDALLAFRGTNTLYDVLTDAHAGNLFPSSTGKMVHSGFYKTFLSFKRDMEKFFTQFSPRRIHCVGHSLGGAVATLAAEWLVVEGIGEPVLYTFGSPRVGSANFAKFLTEKVHDENIYRVYHKSDPVSMVPIWPFTHVPLPGTDCFIDTPGSFTPSMHKMENYITSVTKGSIEDKWENLKRNRPIENNDKMIEAWLNARNPLTITYYNMLFVQQAITFVIKKILYLTGISFQGLVIAGVSNFLDLLAFTFEMAAKISIEVAGYIQNLIRRIMSAIGMVVDTVKNLTASFIRWVLWKFTEAVFHLARMALHVSRR